MTDDNKSLIIPDTSLTSLGQIFATSGYFQDAKDAAKAVVKILAGRELGLPPIASMTGINIIKGKVSLSAVAMATVLKKHGSYDYRVKRNDHKGCEIEFFYKGESLGMSSFTLEDAKQAKLFDTQPNYKKYPRNMLFARAMSNGIRWYCPEVLGGPTYTPGELDASADVGIDENNTAYEIVDENSNSDIVEFADFLNEQEKAREKVKQLANDGLSPPTILAEIEKDYEGYTLPQIVKMMEEQ